MERVLLIYLNAIFLELSHVYCLFLQVYDIILPETNLQKKYIYDDFLFSACLLNAGTGRPYYDTVSTSTGRTGYEQVPQPPITEPGPPPTVVTNPSPGDDSGSRTDAEVAGTSNSGGVMTAQSGADLIASAGEGQEKKPMHPKLLNVTAQLEMKDLWDEFDHLGTEMIVTKAGR